MGLLRFLLAISVVIAHSSSIFGIDFVGGQIAVQSFYIISGFYMALVLNEKYIGENNSYKLFISNRLLRLYPIYWVVLILTILFSVYLYIDSDGNDFGRLTFYKNYCNDLNFGSVIFLIFTNVFLFFQDIVMFLGLNTLSGSLYFTSNFKESNPMLYEFLLVPQAWTIGIEIMFYVIAPFLVRRKIKTLLFLVLMSLVLRCVLYYGMNLNYDPWTVRFFPAELLFFLLGTLSYHLYKGFQKIEFNKNILFLIWGAVILTTVLYGFISLEYKDVLYLILFFISIPFIFILTKRYKWDAYIGELSYPIYISHVLIIIMLGKFKIPVSGFTLSFFTIVISLLLNEFIAKKVEKIRQLRIKNA